MDVRGPAMGRRLVFRGGLVFGLFLGSRLSGRFGFGRRLFGRILGTARGRFGWRTRWLNAQQGFFIGNADPASLFRQGESLTFQTTLSLEDRLLQDQQTQNVLANTVVGIANSFGGQQGFGDLELFQNIAHAFEQGLVDTIGPARGGLYQPSAL